GVFHWRYAWSTGVVIAELIGRGTIALVIAAATRDPVRRQERVLAAIRAACQRARRWVPIGHREVVFPDEGEAIFDRPGLIVANHESHADSVLLLALPTSAVVLIKPWIGRVPILGRVVQRAGFHVVREGDADHLHEVARAAFARGVSVIGYPSDTRSRDGRTGRFHNGAFALARALDVDVVPVALVNTRTAMRPGTWWIGDHTLRAVVLDRVSPRNFTGDLADRRMARAVRDRIRDACDAHWAEVQELPGWEKPIEVLLRYLDPERARVERTWLRDPFLARLPHLLRSDGLKEDGVGDDPPASDGPIVIVGAECGALIARATLAFPLRRFVIVESDETVRGEARAFAKPTVAIEWTDAGEIEAVLPAATEPLTVISLTGMSSTTAAALVVAADRWRESEPLVAWTTVRAPGDPWSEWLESVGTKEDCSPMVSRFEIERQR
ncbi:MAG: lysophospholipid acyltransferase family protein, partial [Planctomycetota bacterium]